MKKKIVSMASIIMLLTFLFGGTLNAQESGLQCVDGSYLTMQEKSTGSTQNSLQKGVHLMDGDSMISKAGSGKIYVYTQTTANHDVDKLAVLTYVDRYNEETEAWGQIDYWPTEDFNTYYVSSGKLLNVEKGHYYRVRASHMVRKDGEFEETVSFTDGIWID